MSTGMLLPPVSLGNLNRKVLVRLMAKYGIEGGDDKER
jgi:hypothetical protein